MQDAKSAISSTKMLLRVQGNLLKGTLSQNIQLVVMAKHSVGYDEKYYCSSFG